MAVGAIAQPRFRVFAPGVLGRMWSRTWPLLAFYPLVIPAGLFRGIADDIGFPVRSSFTAIEGFLLSTAPNHLLQGSLIDVYATRQVALALYVTWFMAPLTTALGVILFRPRDYWRFIAFLVIVYYAAMPFFALYPLEPPWAHDPDIRRFVAERWPGPAAADPNPFAAMPSLHIALPAAAAFWYGWRPWYGKAVWAYTAALAFGIVYAGDHYLADAAAGVLLAYAVHRTVRALRLPLLASEAQPQSDVSATPPAAAHRAAA
jgi:hypothetical protein